MLTLGISTSSGQFALVLGESNKVIFDSNDFKKNDELDDLLLLGLDYCKKNINEISNIIVDIGPGGTSRVRTGIAFANGIAYTLNIPICPVSSMELAGIDAWDKYQLPVISSVKSIKENAYIGFYNNQQLISIEYGKIENIVPSMVNDIDKFVIVGFHRDMMMNLPLLKCKIMVDSDMLFGNVRFFVEKSDLFFHRGLLFPKFAQPITEKTLQFI